MTDRPGAPPAGAGAYLGIDVGSTSTKAVVFDVHGAPLAAATSGYEISRPLPDRAEQDAGDWTGAVDASVLRVAARVDLATVRAVGVTGQVDTHVLTGAGFAPLLPALLWQDVRSAAEADTLNAHLGEAGRLAGWGRSQPLDASSPVPRALWLARHEPAAWAASRWMMLPKDLVNAWLTGVAATDPFASFPVVGADGRYVPGVARAPGLAGRLPPLVSPEQGVGVTDRPWHGVSAGTMVATGTMDAFANVLGSGLHEPGDTMVVIGTSAIVAAVGAGASSGPGVVSFAPYRGRQVHAGPTQSGGDSLRWWARATGHTAEEVLGAAAAAAPGAGGVVFAPHLLGERAPLWDTEVRAWFTGVHAATGFAELSRAVLEGVAFSVRELLEAVEAAATVPAGRVVLSGGGSRSPLWCQVVADVTGRVVHRSLEPDTAVVGAAVLAAAAYDGSDPWAQAPRLARHDRVLTPDPAARARYDALFGLYRDTYASLREVHHRLRSL